MANSLSNLVNNLSVKIHRFRCKYGHDDKKCETCEIKYKYCNCFFEYTNFQDNLIEYKCLCCNKNYQHTFDEKLKERFFNTYKFSNLDNDKSFYCSKKVFILMNISMIGKSLVKHYYLKKNYRYITDADYAHGKRVCKDFEIKSLGEYHDLYVQSETLLLLDVFEICVLQYTTTILQNPFSAPGLA